MLKRLPLLLLAAAAAPVAAQSAEERARLEAVAERGRLIFELDRAAWVATDDLREKRPDFQNEGFAGYVVERAADGPVVTFYGEEGGELVAMYVAKIGARGVASSRVLAREERKPLTDVQRRLAETQRATLNLDQRPCAEAPFNTAIIPPATAADPVDMYLLTPQVDGKVLPFGGHYLVTVAADGTVVNQRKFTNSCLDMRVDAGAAALMTTHLLDPHPTEIHVFLSLAAGKPLYVGTANPERIWVVVGDEIRLVPED
jgi:hypothetical protein